MRWHYRLGLLILLLTCATAAHAQLSAYNTVAIQSGGQAIPKPTVTVCVHVQPPTNPCTGTLATLSIDSAGDSLTNPFQGDGAGNINFWTAPGTYDISVAAPALNLPTNTYSFTLGNASGGSTFNAISSGTNTTAAMVLGSGSSLTTSGMGTISGTTNPATLNGIIFVDGMTYPTIQAAVNAANGANPKSGVIIPSAYSGTDTFTDPGGVIILDMRRSIYSRFVEALRSDHGFSSVRNVTGLITGNDVPLFSEGQADVYVATSPLVGTTTATINIGANASVLVSSFAINGGGSTVGNTSVLDTAGNLIIGGCSGCSTEEYVGPGNWSVVDATHLSITAAKSHSGTTDIEQVGSAILEGRRLVLNCQAIKPAQQTNAQCLITDPSLETIIRTPNVSTDTWPLGGLGIGVDLTGLEGANSDLAFRNNNSASLFHFRKSDASQDVFLATDTQFIIGTGNTFTIRSTGGGQVNFQQPSTASVFNMTIPANSGTIAETNFAQTWSANQSFNSGTLLPSAAGGTDLGSTSLPFGNLWLGTTATSNFKFAPAATSAQRVVTLNDPGAAVNLPFTSNSDTTTTHVLHATATGNVFAASAIATGDLPATAVQTGQTNVYGAFLQDFTSGTMEIPEATGFVANVNSTIGLDLTANITHLWTNNADSLAAATTSTSTTTTQPLFATAVAGIYNPRAIATGDLPNLPLNQIISPTGAVATFADGNNPVTVNCAQTTNTQDCWTFGETSAATNGTLTNLLANQAELHTATASASTATPLEVEQAGCTATTCAPLAQFESTWNNASLVGQGIIENVTNTSSAAGSLLINLQVGNATVASVDKTGYTVESIASMTTGNQIISGADYTNSTTTPSTVFTWTLPATAAAKTYRYSCDMMWESTNTTLTGPQFGVNISAAPTQLTAANAAQNTLAGADINGYISNTTTGHQNVGVGTAAGVTNTNYWARMWGTIEGAPTAGSTFIIDAAALSNTTSTVNIRRGSSCQLTATN